MRPAPSPRPLRDHRVLVVDAARGDLRVLAGEALASAFEPNDLLVVNDAATLPASLVGTADGAPVEARLVHWVEDRRWTAALFGDGDHRTPTEHRSPPPPADVLDFGGLRARVVARHALSPRLVDLAFDAASDAAFWSALYRVGRPVQYAHVPEPLALWDVQNVYAGRPWAVEMPSAGRVLRMATLLALRARGVAVATLTHAAGISSVGDLAIDAQLPFPERYEVEEETWEAIARARAARGRIVAIGTSVLRALEGGARAGRRSGVTDLRIGPGFRRSIVDAVLTGVHDVGTSHFELLHAFASPALLARTLAHAEAHGLVGHELGDACLVWGEARASWRREAA